jgi:hypothetical protein
MSPYSFRLPVKHHQQLVKYCRKKFDRDAADVMREMVKALLEDRLTIQPTEGQAALYQPKEINKS